MILGFWAIVLVAPRFFATKRSVRYIDRR
jgi:hypothetical protein